jgi:prepilin-type N-terminal cleavage/methylation domain-containing protein
MSHPSTPGVRSGLTLLELIASITIMSVIAVAVFPVIASAADGYASATRTRERTERVAFALDRCVRLLREATGSDPAGALDLASAAPDRVVFADGRGLGLSGTTLVYLEAGQPDAPLCRDVSAFEITYLASDGVTDTIGAPETTQRFNVSITADGLTLAGSAFARTRIGD